jgi:ABC-2 type transport system permease protein
MTMATNLRALWAVYLRGLVILYSRLGKNLVSLFLSPTLYALAFGWGVGRNLDVEGVPYLAFMLPGLMALSGMTMSFSIATEINIARFLSHFFEEYLLSPAKDAVVVLGNILYGVTKGLCSFAAVLLIGLLFGVRPRGGALLLLPVLLNSCMFASLGVWIALSVRGHRDMTSFTSFVITPMSFIAGTFFSLESLPRIFHVLTELIPLTHSSVTIRALFLGRPVAPYHYLVMFLYTVFFFLMAVSKVRKAVS